MRLPDDLAARLRGRAVLTIPEAGALMGLSPDGSYDAARRGLIPTIPTGARKRAVPLGALLKLLGFEDTANAEGAAPTAPSNVMPLATDKGLRREQITRAQ